MREPQSQSGRKSREPLDPGGFGYARLFSSRPGIPELDRSAFQPRICSIENPSTQDISIAAHIFGVKLSPLALWEIQQFCAGEYDLSQGGLQELADGPVKLSFRTNRSKVIGNSSPSIQFDLDQRDWYQQPLAQMEICGAPCRGELRPQIVFRFSREYADGWQIVDRLFRAFSHGLAQRNFLAHDPIFIRGPYRPIEFSTSDSKVIVRAERVTQTSSAGSFFHLHPRVFPLAVAGARVPSLDERMRLVGKRLEEQFGIFTVRIPHELEANDPSEFLAKVAHSRKEQPWIYSGSTYGISVIEGNIISFPLNATSDDALNLIHRVQSIERQMARSARDRAAFKVTSMDVEIDSVEELSRLFASTGARGLRTRYALDGLHVLINDFILSKSDDPLKELATASRHVFDFLCPRTKNVSVEASLCLTEEGAFRKFVKIYVRAPSSTACQLMFTEGAPLHCQISPNSSNLVLEPSLVQRVGDAFDAPCLPKTVQKFLGDEKDPSRTWLIPEKLSVNTAPMILWSGDLP